MASPRSTNQGFRRSSGGINLSRSRMWREIRSNKRAPAVRGPLGACVPVKRRNLPRKRAASPSNPSESSSESPLACTASTAAFLNASASSTSPVVTSVQTAKPFPQATAHRKPLVLTQPPLPASRNWFRVAWHRFAHVLRVLAPETVVDGSGSLSTYNSNAICLWVPGPSRHAFTRS